MLPDMLYLMYVPKKNSVNIVEILQNYIKESEFVIHIFTTFELIITSQIQSFLRYMKTFCEEHLVYVFHLYVTNVFWMTSLVT